MPKLHLPLLATALALVVVTATVFALTATADGSTFSAQAGDDQTLECTSPQGALVALDGASSTASGENDTIVSYTWYEGYNTSGERILGTAARLNVTLGLGAHALTLVVMNSTNETRADNVTVTVRDTTAPTIDAVLARDLLWPPNHKMQTVDVAVSASDACSTPTWVLESVASDEADDGKGDGHTTGDVQDAQTGTPDTRVQLRAERMGGGDGRAYTLTYAATDGSGNVARASVVVAVPAGSR